MKKGFIALTLVIFIGLGLVTANAFAWNNNCGGPGYGIRGGAGNYKTSVNSEDYQNFLNETVQIRKSLATDRAELDALMVGQNPNPDRVRELAAKIADNEEALNKIASSSNMNAPVQRGYGRYSNCDGSGAGYGNCSGSGRRGYGRF